MLISLKRHLTPLMLSILFACIALFLFERLADEMMEGDTANFDQTVRNFVHGFSSPALTEVMRVFTTIGNIGGVLVASAIGCAVLWWRHRRDGMVFLLLSISGGAFLMYILKILFHRQRPQPYFGITVPSDYSFPSGHALVAFCFYATLAAILNTGEHRRATRIAIWLGALIMVLGIGISRIYLGVHYPSDVVAGYLAAIFWVTGVSLVYRRMRRTGATQLKQQSLKIVD